MVWTPSREKSARQPRFSNGLEKNPENDRFEEKKGMLERNRREKKNVHKHMIQNPVAYYEQESK